MKKFIKSNAIILLFTLSALVVLGVSIYASMLMTNTTNLLQTSTERHLLLAAQSAARLVTAEELDQFLVPEDMEKPAYEALHQRLYTFSQENGLLFTYYLRPYGDQLQFVIDSDPDMDTRVTLYDIVDMEDAPQKALQGQPSAPDLGSYSVNWDHIFSAYAPVYDDAGNIYCIAGVDISDEDLLGTRESFRSMIGLQIAALIVALYSGVMGLYLYRIQAQQSEAANIAKSQFLSRMSHEIRTPMNAIIGLNRMAKQSDDIGQIKEYLNTMDTSAAHLLTLINDVLDLSKIESGKLELETLPASVQGELDNVDSIIAPQARAKNQQFRIILDPKLPSVVYCDAIHITQVVVNLLSNAVKFTPSGGSIQLELKLLDSRDDKAKFHFSVTDSGIGIAPQYLSKLFDPFEQGDGGTTRKYGGTGLGLSISKQLIEMMGGTIEVKSTPGSGSIFSFDIWLKMAPPEALRTSVFSRGEDPVDLSGRHLLVVEDSEVNQLIAEDIFTGMGACVTLASNGQAGLQEYLSQPEHYDIIFMDIQMPVMDGYEATRRIRASSTPTAGSIPIIAMTANVFKEDIQNAMDAGMNAHVGKPFELSQIQAAIRDVLSL